MINTIMKSGALAAVLLAAPCSRPALRMRKPDRLHPKLVVSASSPPAAPARLRPARKSARRSPMTARRSRACPAGPVHQQLREPRLQRAYSSPPSLRTACARR